MFHLIFKKYFKSGTIHIFVFSFFVFIVLNIIENYSYVKSRKNYYNKTEYAIFYVQNGQYTEVVTFIYNDGKEIDKRSITEFSNYYNDISSYLRQYNMQY